jgi:hypothetical protein
MLKKLFGGINFPWPKLVIFAVICGVYTGITTLIPGTADTSLRDISISFEWWILFALILIANSKSPLDSALKVFVFFLISQPLVYLVQVPFHPDGFGLFRYYRPWFIWTLLTFPMAFVGHYMKKDKWWGLLILAPMLVFLGYHYTGFLTEAVSFFPNHLLSAIFCAVTLILYPLVLFQDKKIRLAGLVISLVILVAMSVIGIASRHSAVYSTDLLSSGGEIAGVEFDDTYQVRLADEKYGSASIIYEDSIQCYMIHADFTKTGQTQLVLESPTGEQYVYDLTIYRYSYDIARRP